MTKRKKRLKVLSLSLVQRLISGLKNWIRLYTSPLNSSTFLRGRGKLDHSVVKIVVPFCVNGPPHSPGMVGYQLVGYIVPPYNQQDRHVQE